MGRLVILLESVTTPIPGSATAPIPSELQEDLDPEDDATKPPYTAYTFETKSRSRGGTFVRLRPSATNLDTQPRVRVGNILGTGSGNDLTERVVTVTPATSYPGEKHNYIVTFTAPGPMYNSSLTVTFPPNVLKFPDGRTASNQISVSAPGVSYTVGDITDEIDTADNRRILTGALTVNLTRINIGQKVTITLKDATVTDVGQVTATTTMEGDRAQNENVTSLTGGVFAPVAGSGTLTVSPGSVRVDGTPPITRSSITVTYTAATELDECRFSYYSADWYYSV